MSWKPYQDRDGVWYIRDARTGATLCRITTSLDRVTHWLVNRIAAVPDLIRALETVNEWNIDSRGEDFPYPVLESALEKAKRR